MTVYGLTDTGFNRKIYGTIADGLKAKLRDRISKRLRLDEKTYLGNLVAILSESFDELWEILEAVVGGLDPDNAVEALLVAASKLTGVYRYGERYGTALIDVSFSQTRTIAAGALVVAQDGDSTNLWQNEVAINGTAAGTVEGVAFRSVNPGSAAAAGAGTLTVVVSGGTGVSGVTNPEDATPGRDVETLDELRLRRDRSLARAGRATVAAIQTAVLTGIDGEGGVAGVQDCRVLENDTAAVDGNGIPARSIWVLVWDGVGEDAVDDQIAQRIYSVKAGGTPTYGSESGTAIDPWGDPKTIYFGRMTGVDISIDVTALGEASETVIKDAILAYVATVPQGEILRWSKVFGAAVSVPGVDAITALTLQKGVSAPVSTDLTFDPDEKALYDAADISVTIS